MRNRERGGKGMLGEAIRTVNQIRDEEEKAAASTPAKGQIRHITIRANLAERMHWQSRVKAEGTSLTDVITTFLRDRYGSPPGSTGR